MIRLENSIYLYGLLFVPICLILFWMMMRWKKSTVKKFGEFQLVSELMPDASIARQRLKFLLVLAGLIFLVLGITNPQIGSKMEEVKRQGVDVIIALDISNSMKAEDIRPNRLDRAKQAISRFVDKLQNDRIGIIVFAGNAYVQLPLTTDYGAAKLFASIIDCDMIPTQGTAIGSAIELAEKSFVNEEKKYKALIVITDGENHEDDALGAAKEASEKGIVIHTIGMASQNGAPIPLSKNNSSGGFRKDNEGNTVISKLDETLLQQIAISGNGKFVRASTSDDGLETLLGEINKMEKKEFGMKMYTDYEDRFQYFLAAALLFLASELFLSDKKNKLLSRIDLFGKNI